MAQGKYQRRRRRLNPTFPIFVLMVLSVTIGLIALLARGCNANRNDAPATLPSDEAAVAATQATASTEQITLPTEEITVPTQETTEPTEETSQATAQTSEPTEKTTQQTTESTEPTEPVSIGQQVANTAKAQIGKPYLYGGSGPDSFDTTGLIHYCYKQADIDVPRQLSAQADFGTEVASQDDLQPGDVVFFWTDTPDQPQHPAIYVGGGKLIAAFRTDVPVGEVSLNESYYAEHYITARRLH